METFRKKGLSRRQVLSSTVKLSCLLLLGERAEAATLSGPLPWRPFDHSPPDRFIPGNWLFFRPEEVRAIEAIVERLIPADDLSVSGKEAGCAEFIDRQLAGFYGGFERLYMQGPFQAGTPLQGDQSPLVPRQRYRDGLASLDAYCRQKYQKSFADLPPETRDQVLSGLETRSIQLPGFDGKMFFDLVLLNTMEGFFADPIYGGNRDMVSWKMLGFPGARYDYRDYIDIHNKKIDLPPLSIAGRIDWTVKG